MVVSPLVDLSFPVPRLQAGRRLVWGCTSAGVSFRAAHAGPVISLGVRQVWKTKKPLSLTPVEEPITFGDRLPHSGSGSGSTALLASASTPSNDPILRQTGETLSRGCWWWESNPLPSGMNGDSRADLSHQHGWGLHPPATLGAPSDWFRKSADAGVVEFQQDPMRVGLRLSEVSSRSAGLLLPRLSHDAITNNPACARPPKPAGRQSPFRGWVMLTSISRPWPCSP